MSTQSISAPGGMPTGELAAVERVRQLQTLIAQARSVSLGQPATAAAGASATGAAEGVPADFASALAAASGAGQASAEPAGAAPSSASGGYEALATEAAIRNGVDPALLHGLIQQESGFDPNAQSGAGAMGLTQLMPGTASSLGVSNPMDPSESVEGGARYLSQLLRQFGGNTVDALAAYNAGPGAVEQYGGVPPYAETQSYVSKVLGYAEAYRREHPSQSGVGAAA
jgi:soluble lytic murein transglycosylase-like protein